MCNDLHRIFLTHMNYTCRVCTGKSCDREKFYVDIIRDLNVLIPLNKNKAVFGIAANISMLIPRKIIYSLLKVFVAHIQEEVCCFRLLQMLVKNFPFFMPNKRLYPTHCQLHTIYQFLWETTETGPFLIHYSWIRSRGSAVGIAIGYGLDDGKIGVRVPAG
jgi:hypothetical protein